MKDVSSSYLDRYTSLTSWKAGLNLKLSDSSDCYPTTWQSRKSRSGAQLPQAALSLVTPSSVQEGEGSCSRAGISSHIQTPCARR